MNILSDFTISLNSLPIILALIIRVITSIILLALVIPLQYRQATVKNGLKTLRKALLFSGFLIFWVNTVGLVIIVIRPIAHPETVKFVTDFVSVLNIFGFFALAVLWLLIYRQQFTDINIKLHEKIEKEEKKKEKSS